MEHFWNIRKQVNYTKTNRARTHTYTHIHAHAHTYIYISFLILFIKYLQNFASDIGGINSVTTSVTERKITPRF